MFNDFLESIIDLVFPKNCILCKHSLKAEVTNGLLCMACWNKIERNLPPFCQKCGRHLSNVEFDNKICLICQKRAYYFNRVFSATCYSGIIKELIHLFKYRGKTYLVKPLAKIMLEFINNYNFSFEDFQVVVPMPLHSTRQREREFNQSEGLAKEINHKINFNLSINNLQRLRNTRPQSALCEKDRFKNIANAFKVKNPNVFQDKSVLIIDDLFTTGATSSEAAHCLKKAGAHRVDIFTLAITQT